MIRAERPDNAQQGIVREPDPLRLDYSQAKALVLERFEKHYLSSLLLHTKGNVTLAASLAGKERRALGKLLKKHSIERGEYSSRT